MLALYTVPACMVQYHIIACIYTGIYIYMLHACMVLACAVSYIDHSRTCREICPETTYYALSYTSIYHIQCSSIYAKKILRDITDTDRMETSHLIDTSAHITSNFCKRVTMLHSIAQMKLRPRELRTSKWNNHAFTTDDVDEILEAYGAASFATADVALLREATEDIPSTRLMVSPVRPLRQMVTKLVDRVRYSTGCG
jgi:hypothetical protein